ncbi:DNA topoisomerase IB [Pseudacidovorax intermedius]|uniref:DNA topoisomerase n=1 Tax=Pseudacidovorax intermedius TaxID=433924 RepID=A0A147GYJ7_9BURK|nr:DNA topoisomerase IB [Pseudacidovorax intermedius]KTT22592.1 DNA topoisomerase [Pseudacidovorax intermedius]
MLDATASTSQDTPAAAAAPTPIGNGLLYVSSEMPGIQRVRSGGGAADFRYRDAKGRWIRDAAEITRIRKLAIPPAYEQVWICPLANGHLQATGLDARGRRQYRYHPDWRLLKDEAKFERLEQFGQALPRIRARVRRDLDKARGKPSREAVLAAIVRLLDTTYLRVGNEEYARTNNSFGLTTLRNRHLQTAGGQLKLRFRGKSGVMHEAKVDDKRVARVVRQCQQLPGQALFQYVDEDGEQRHVSSGDVNDYLREATGGEFTAKDFRTWHGSVQALELTRLACDRQVDEPAGLRIRAKEILGAVAKQLGNTPAVCRKAYIHPAVLALGTKLSADAQAMAEVWDGLGTARTRRGLLSAEGRLMEFLRRHRLALQREARKLKRASATGAPRPARS